MMCYKNLYKGNYTMITYTLFCGDITYIIVVNYDPSNQYLHINVNVSKQLITTPPGYNSDKALLEANNILRVFFLLVGFYKKNCSRVSENKSFYIKEATGIIRNTKTDTLFDVRDYPPEPFEGHSDIYCYLQSHPISNLEYIAAQHIPKYTYYRLARLYNYFYNYIKTL